MRDRKTYGFRCIIGGWLHCFYKRVLLPGDGGHGTYAIRAKNVDDVDNDGSIILLANGNVAELITDGTANVKQFGAKGDGITDDTTAFQRMFSSDFKKIPHSARRLFRKQANLQL